MPNESNQVRGEPLADRPPAPAAGSQQVFQRLDRTEPAPYSLRERLLRAVWNCVNQTIWRVPRGWGWRRFLLRTFGAKVGAGTIFRASSRIFHPWLFEIGTHSTLGPGVMIYNLGRVRVGDHTVLSQDTFVCAGTHDYTLPTLPLVRSPIVIGSGVWVAAQAFIGPGVTIGENCVIAARAVVSTDIPPGTVAGGNPARVIKPRKMNMPDHGPHDSEKPPVP